MENTSVIFLAVPASLNDEIRHFSHNHTGEEEPDLPIVETEFEVDPSILLPVELEPGENRLDPDKLSWEMIISGMLKVISISARGGRLILTGTDGKKIPPIELIIKNGDIISESGLAGISPEWINYYRRFVLTVKPEIYHEFTGATIVKAGNGEFDLALEINGVLEGLFPGSPGVLLNKALLLEDRAAALEKNGREAGKENAEALEAYQIALSMEPVLSDTYFNAGFFFMRQRDFAMSKDCFSRFISLGEESDDQSEFSEEKMKQAKKIIREISSQGLDDNSFREAYDCINQGKDEEGLIKIREFIENHPKVWNGWFVLGWALRKLGRFADGLEALKKASELGGHSGDILNEKAICLMEQGDLDGAQKELIEALRDEPENIKIISNLGVLAIKAGKKDEAAAFFRTVLELDPNDPLAKWGLGIKDQSPFPGP